MIDASSVTVSGPPAARRLVPLEDMAPIGLALAYAVTIHLFATSIGADDGIALGNYLPSFFLGFVLCSSAGLAALMLWTLVRDRPERLLPQVRRQLLAMGCSGPALLRSVPVLILLPLFLSVFSSYKALIPTVRPFDWDRSFAALDRALHGGVDSWMWLQPILGSPWITFAVDALYHPVWSIAFVAVWCWQALDRRDPVLRLQFLLAFLMVWILLGSIGATFMSSAGPCYYGRVGGGTDPFAPLLAYLAEVHQRMPLTSAVAQDALWRAYVSGFVGAGSGISAMPSVHVATTLLFVLLGRRHSRSLALGFGALLAVVLVGSVHLGWHYAVDSYAAIVVTVPIWLIAGWAARRIAPTIGAGSSP
jgi:hypothetical protein